MIVAGGLRDLKESQKNLANFGNPRVSKATMFIEKGPEKAFDTVLQSRSPVKEMNKLMAMAKRDQTGEALDGLKAAFNNMLLKRSELSMSDKSGDAFVSGQKFFNLINDKNTQLALKTLYRDDPGAINRLTIIARTAKRMDAARNAKQSVEGVLGDGPGKTATALAGVMGATFGRQFASLTGGGTVQVPGIFANRFRDMLNAGVVDPAKRLIIDAMQDEQLFKHTLNIRIKGDELPPKTRKVFNAWVNAVMVEHGKSLVSEEQQPTPSG